MLVAQALGEYVAVGALVSAFTDAWVRVNAYVSGIEPSTWLIVGGVVLFLCYFWSRAT